MKTARFPRWWPLALAVLGAALGLLFFLARPRARALRLADGTEAFFRAGASIAPAAGFPKPREVRVNGDLLLVVPAAAGPLVVRTRLLILAVDGPASLRITAFAVETGEQAEVLRGRVVARKAYPSPYAEPDTLGDGEMILINRTIDLAEKEKADLPKLRRWSERIVRSAGAPRPYRP